MILENETFEQFGYYPKDLTSHSHKLVMWKCAKCKTIGRRVFRDCRCVCQKCKPKRIKKIYNCCVCGSLICRETAIIGTGLCVKCSRQIHNRAFSWITKDLLKKYNYDQQLNCLQIAKILDVSVQTVSRYFKKYNILTKIYRRIHKNKKFRCIDCAKELKRPETKRCVKCFAKHNSAENNSRYQGTKYYCIDCGNLLSDYRHNRCKKCSWKHLSGKNHPNYGKNIILPNKIQYNNKWFRSSWEANFAKWLDLSGIKWRYEPKAFPMKINGKDTNYIPDFYLTEFDTWIEIKGWWQHNAKDKFKKFFTKHPNTRLFEKAELQMLGII